MLYSSYTHKHFLWVSLLCYPWREVYASTCNFEWKSLKEIMHIELVKIEYIILSPWFWSTLGKKESEDLFYLNYIINSGAAPGAAGAIAPPPPMIFVVFLCLWAQRSVMSMMIIVLIPLAHVDNFCPPPPSKHPGAAPAYKLTQYIHGQCHIKIMKEKFLLYTICPKKKLQSDFPHG